MFTFANALADAFASPDPWVNNMADRAIEALRAGDVQEACRLLDIPVED